MHSKKTRKMLKIDRDGCTCLKSSTWDAEVKGPKFKAIMGYLLRFCVKKKLPKESKTTHCTATY